MIYLDNGATTRMAPEVLEAMLPYLGGEFGNPSAVYSLGARAKKAVNEARRSIAGLVGARHILFAGRRYGSGACKIWNNRRDNTK